MLASSQGAPVFPGADFELADGLAQWQDRFLFVL
jgi:hypothetical protein